MSITDSSNLSVIIMSLNWDSRAAIVRDMSAMEAKLDSSSLKSPNVMLWTAMAALKTDIVLDAK